MVSNPTSLKYTQNHVPNMKRRFICYGGYVTSSNDNDSVYVSARQLPRLYGVNPALCYFVDEPHQAKGLPTEFLQPLRPDSSGHYYLPSEYN